MSLIDLTFAAHAIPRTGRSYNNRRARDARRDVWDSMGEVYIHPSETLEQADYDLLREAINATLSREHVDDEFTPLDEFLVERSVRDLFRLHCY